MRIFDLLYFPPPLSPLKTLFYMPHCAFGLLLSLLIYLSHSACSIYRKLFEVGYRILKSYLHFPL